MSKVRILSALGNTCGIGGGGSGRVWHFRIWQLEERSAGENPLLSLLLRHLRKQLYIYPVSKYIFTRIINNLPCEIFFCFYYTGVNNTNYQMIKHHLLSRTHHTNAVLDGVLFQNHASPSLMSTTHASLSCPTLVVDVQ